MDLKKMEITRQCDMSLFMAKPVYAICKQQSCKSNCTDVQSDKHFCYSQLRLDNTYSSISTIPRLLLVSVAEHAGLNWSKNFKDRFCHEIYEPRYDKTNKMSELTVKTQVSLGICPVW